MEALLQIPLILLLAYLGYRLARLFSNCHLWLLGYMLPLALIVAVVIANKAVPLGFYPPFSWLMKGRVQFVAMAPAISCIFTVLIPRLKSKREGRFVGVLATLFLLYFCISPFVLPPLVRPTLLRLQTRIDANGVCRQATDYTCGPAAAVTALRQLGLEAEEGDLAIRAYTSPHLGTTNDNLRAAIVSRFPGQIQVDLRPFATLADLRAATARGPTIAMIKFSFILDHFVTVLHVTDGEILLADPAMGQRTLSPAAFEKIWRHTGLVITRR